MPRLTSFIKHLTNQLENHVDRLKPTMRNRGGLQYQSHNHSYLTQTENTLRASNPLVTLYKDQACSVGLECAFAHVEAHPLFSHL